MADLWIVFVIGLLGSAHCVGMCGGFVLALSQGKANTPQLHGHQVTYYAGKTITYAILGAIAGGTGALIGSLFSGVQDVLSILLGIFLIGIGLSLVGLFRHLKGLSWVARFKPIKTGLAYFMRKQSMTGTFGLGLLNGLLPCGLVYALLAKAAATGTVMGGAATMAVFGLATIPALYGLALAGILMRPVWRVRMNLVSGVLVILLGMMTIIRGTPAIGPVMRWLHLGGHGQHEMMDHPGGETEAPSYEGHSMQ